jgi:site-specific DNA-cytosine methylase
VEAQSPQNVEGSQRRDAHRGKSKRTSIRHDCRALDSRSGRCERGDHGKSEIASDRINRLEDSEHLAKTVTRSGNSSSPEQERIRDEEDGSSREPDRGIDQHEAHDSQFGEDGYRCKGVSRSERASQIGEELILLDPVLAK